MAKKKVLFIIPEYSIGGTNTSLDNLLRFLDQTKYEVSIYCLYEDGGTYFKQAFRPYILPKSRLYHYLHDHHVTRKLMGAVQKVMGGKCWNRIYAREVRWLQKHYSFDTVVGFQEGTATEFAARFENVKRVAWFHSPYIEFLHHNDKRIYEQFDAIACVSKTFVKLFEEEMPQLKGRIHCVYNTLNDKLINELANQSIDDDRFDNSVFTMVSVGRACAQKQFEKIPSIVRQMRDDGMERPFHWYIIASGDNQYSELYKQEIARLDVGDSVVLLGRKENPYPYIKKADLVVCTSESESFSYAINEGKILHTPVVSNDFPVAHEVLKEDCGFVSALEDMPRLLARIIKDEDGCYSKLQTTVQSFRYENEEIVQQVNKLL